MGGLGLRLACAALTYAQGLGIKELAASDRKEILFYRSPWLGISSVVLLLFVVVFTNVRVRGIYSFTLVLIAVMLVWAASYLPGIDMALGWLSLVRVYLNSGVYLVLHADVIWFFATISSTATPGGASSPGQGDRGARAGQARARLATPRA